MKRFLAFALFLACAPRAFAHKPSDGYLTIDIEGTTVSGQLDLALKDLELALGVDRSSDGKITWGELKAQRGALEAYARERLKIRNGQTPCELVPLDLQVSDHTDGAYASLIFNTTCMDQPVAGLDIDYSFLFDLDAQHRGLMSMAFREQQITHAFTAEEHAFHFDANGGGLARQLGLFGREGLHHIFRGYDHMLFLIALLLPAVFARRGRQLVPRERLQGVLLETTKVVTAFTAAHTLSLCLTTFHVLAPPPTRLVESLVALTIVLTALNNIVPVISENRWAVGFTFGLVHGIGYASVLTDLGLEGWHLASPLVGFNLGVETAQLIVIAAFLPVAYLLRGTRFYRTVFLFGGSVATCVFAMGWMFEQIARVSIMPF